MLNQNETKKSELNLKNDHKEASIEMCFHNSFNSFGLFMLLPKSLNTQGKSKKKNCLLVIFSKTELFFWDKNIPTSNSCHQLCHLSLIPLSTPIQFASFNNYLTILLSLVLTQTVTTPPSFNCTPPQILLSLFPHCQHLWRYLKYSI